MATDSKLSTTGTLRKFLVTLPGHADRIIEAPDEEAARKTFIEKHQIFNVQAEPIVKPVEEKK